MRSPKRANPQQFHVSGQKHQRQTSKACSTSEGRGHRRRPNAKTYSDAKLQEIVSLNISLHAFLPFAAYARKRNTKDRSRDKTAASEKLKVNGRKWKRKGAVQKLLKPAKTPRFLRM
jgi:hypothetical protein